MDFIYTPRKKEKKIYTYNKNWNLFVIPIANFISKCRM